MLLTSCDNGALPENPIKDEANKKTLEFEDGDLFEKQLLPDDGGDEGDE
jgi:hypothetical protein